MKKNEVICEGMTPSEIVQFVRSKYWNINSRSGALARLKNFFKKTKDEQFCKELRLSNEEYKQLMIPREQRKRMRRLEIRSDEQMYKCAKEIVQTSANPRQLLPCLVLLIGSKPTSLLRNHHPDLPDLFQEKLNICKAKWPCENLTYKEIKQHYLSSWQYHLKRLFPNFTFHKLSSLVKKKSCIA